MSKMCKKCQSRAAHHRMTTTGNLYCLALNSRGRKMRDARIYREDYWDSAMIWHLPVKYLCKSDFDEKVGASIQQGLTTTIEENHLG